MPSEVIDILESLGPREVIGQAVGVLMTTRHVSRDAAFEMLVQASSRADRKVRVIAAEIVQHQGEPRTLTRGSGGAVDVSSPPARLPCAPASVWRSSRTA